MEQEEARESAQGRGVNRREVLGLIGATAAASLVMSASEQSASAEQVSAPVQSAKSRTVNIDPNRSRFKRSFLPSPKFWLRLDRRG